MVSKDLIRRVTTVNQYTRTIVITCSYTCACGAKESVFAELDGETPYSLQLSMAENGVARVQESIEKKCFCDYYEEIPRRILA